MLLSQMSDLPGSLLMVVAATQGSDLGADFVIGFGVLDVPFYRIVSSVAHD
jgi:hypothetical protein